MFSDHGREFTIFSSKNNERSHSDDSATARGNWTEKFALKQIVPLFYMIALKR